MKKENPNIYQIEKNLKDIFGIFGENITKSVEQIYRLETSNFTSGQFTKTYSAGMEAVNKKFPYGWRSLRKFWNEQPNNRPLGIVVMKENKQAGIKGSGGKKMFIEFPTLFSAMFALAITIKNRGGNSGAWFSTEPEKQKYYEKLLSSQRTTLTEKIKLGKVV